jgi:fructokinase
MILVAGEALLDLVVSDGAVLPSPGGSPYNTARALGRLGVSVGFLGHLSQDRFGSMLAKVLAESGVSLDYTTRGPEPTALAIAHRSADGEADYSFYLRGTTFRQASFPAPGADISALCVGSLALALQPSAAPLEALVEGEHGKRIVAIDPNVRTEAMTEDVGYRARFDRCCRTAHIVKLSASDASWLLPGLGPEKVATRLLDLGAALVVVTLGADGALARTPEAHARVEANRVDVVDTIGAGDAFGAGLLARLDQRQALVPGGLEALEASDLEDVLRFAAAVAALTCARAGAETPTLFEVTALLKRGARS